MSKIFQVAWLRDYSGQALIFFASITLFVIMWLTVVDVVSRDAIDVSITGLFEVTEVLMGILVFAGVPIITARDGHVAVTLMDTFVGPKLRVFQKVVVNIFCVLVLGLFAWLLWDVAETASSYNDVKLFSRIPLAPMGYFMAVMTALSVPIQFSMMFISDKKLQKLQSDSV